MHVRMESDTMRLSYREGTDEKERIFENHSHPSYELIAVLGGDISIVIGNRRFRLRGGEVALIPPLVYHSVAVNAMVPYKRVTALFGTDAIPCEIRAELEARAAESPTASSRVLDMPLAALESVAKGGREARDMPLVSALITELLYAFTFKGEGLSAEHRVHPTVQAVCDYVDAHLCERLVLDDISAALFVSKSSICHLFHSEMKISPKQYVLQKKLSYAARLISEGTPATEAAATVGYGNYASFYKLYKKIFGASPSGSIR